MKGSPLLVGDNRIPGLKIPEHLESLIPHIIKECQDFGLDFYPIVVQKLTYDEISEVASYGGFPVRYPHWKWGMEYEELQRGYEHGNHKIYEMVINCLSLETPVLTERGTRPAEDVVVGDNLVFGSNKRKVVAIKLQQSAATKKIKLSRYNQDIVCSLGHKWRVLSDRGLIWKEANNIVAGDILVGCSNVIFTNSPCNLKWNIEKVLEDTNSNVRNRVKAINPPITMTLALAELLGVLVGDGSVGVQGNENDLYVTVGKEFTEYREYVSSLFRNVFDSDASIQEKPAAFVVMFQSKAAVDFIDYTGIKKGSTFKSKVIPWSIFKSSQEYRAAFLRGLFDTDGYATDQLGLSGYNKELISGVQLLLAEMGIASVIDTEKNGIGVDGTIKEIHVLTIMGKPNLERFRDCIGFTLPHKQLGLDNLLDTEFCSGGGLSIVYLQGRIVKWAKDAGITTYNCPSLGRSLNRMKKELVGFNCLYSFVQRVLSSAAYQMDQEIVDLIRMPMYVVESVEDGSIIPTLDIALEEGHEFVANGLITHNTNPCYIYCLDSNTLVDDVTVISHAIGHNDFFKNNIFFNPTSENMMNQLANDAARIRRYISRWGKEKVTEFIDYVLRLQTLVDPSKAWDSKKIKDPVVSDTRTYYHPDRLQFKEGHEYMDEYLNPKDWREEQDQKAERKDVASQLDIFKEPTKDILGFLRDYAPLKPWQADILSMLYNEIIYFTPQRATKMLNEGWASFVDFNIMSRRGFIDLGQPEIEKLDPETGEIKKIKQCGAVEYCWHKAGVLGGKYSLNPYKLGFCLFLDIEERWNKGRFGDEWEECNDIKQREEWDKNLGLGQEKVLEVRKFYNDYQAISEFFTPDFCQKYEFFEWEKRANGEYVITDRNPHNIKKKLMSRYLNGGLPDIRLTDPNHHNKGEMMLQHYWDGRILYRPYVEPTLQSLCKLWGRNVFLSTRNKDGEEIIYSCHDPERPVQIIKRTDYEAPEPADPKK